MWEKTENYMSSCQKRERKSNLELFRIITMLIIIMHHYVINSGLIKQIYTADIIRVKEVFFLIFGWGGKTGINCFVLITGYFMCTSSITIKKYAKLLGERYFYTTLIFLIFLATSYSAFSVKEMAKVLFPFFNINTNFIGCYLIFYLFIPFLNIFVNSVTEKQHLYLVLLCLIVYTILPSFFLANVTFNYVTWFIVIYLIGSYIRLYPKQWMNQTKNMGVLSLLLLGLSWGSVVVLAYIGDRLGNVSASYFFVSDSNKILAVALSISTFLFFKNIKIRQNKWINRIAASTFGVLLIHANSDTMRRWLWETLKVTDFYYTPYCVIHAIISVFIIYIVCVAIDQLRIELVEKSLFRIIEFRQKESRQ